MWNNQEHLMRTIEKERIKKKIRHILKQYIEREPEEQERLRDDCFLDSLDAMSIAIDIEKEFDIPISGEMAVDPIWCKATVEDLMQYIISETIKKKNHEQVSRHSVRHRTGKKN